MQHLSRHHVTGRVRPVTTDFPFEPSEFDFMLPDDAGTIAKEREARRILKQLGYDSVMVRVAKIED